MASKLEAKDTFQQLIRFLMVGGVATAVQYLVLAILVETGLADAPISSTIGFVLSAGLNYWLNYHFTFGSNAEHRSAILKFATVTSVGLTLNYALMYLLVSILGIHYLLAQVSATMMVLVWNFTANRVWTFKSR
jgi:putative flippase GtrA